MMRRKLSERRMLVIVGVNASFGPLRWCFTVDLTPIEAASAQSSISVFDAQPLARKYICFGSTRETAVKCSH